MREVGQARLLIRVGQIARGQLVERGQPELNLITDFVTRAGDLQQSDVRRLRTLAPSRR